MKKRKSTRFLPNDKPKMKIDKPEEQEPQNLSPKKVVTQVLQSINFVPLDKHLSDEKRGNIF